jgi:beta-N-acetylhexosaminidase
VLSAWPLDRLAAQTVVVPVDESDVAAVATEVAAGAGGVILFGNNAPANLGSLLQRLSAAAPNGIPPMVMTDEEGGAVQRMGNLVGSIPSARDMGATMSAAQIQQLAQTLGERLKGAGVTTDLAPVLDIDGGSGPDNSDPDGTRSFSTNPSVASADGLAFVTGLRAGGVIPVVKHFPGLGSATGNTDVAPAATLPWDRLQNAGLLPFRDAAGARVPAVMIANASVPGLTATPASVSSVVITQELRQALGYQGLVLTDSLSAVALQSAGYSVPDASVAAVAAGADMVLFSADAAQVASITSNTVSAIVAAVQSGKLLPNRLIDAVAHVLAAKNVDVCAAASR